MDILLVCLYHPVICLRVCKAACNEEDAVLFTNWVYRVNVAFYFVPWKIYCIELQLLSPAVARLNFGKHIFHLVAGENWKLFLGIATVSTILLSIFVSFSVFSP